MSKLKRTEIIRIDDIPCLVIEKFRLYGGLRALILYGEQFRYAGLLDNKNTWFLYRFMEIPKD